MRQFLHRLRAVSALLPCLALAGCASTTGSLGYYWQSMVGHLELMQSAEPIDRWVARADIAPALRERLQLAQRARAFAVAELGLPDNASYRRYADLKRPAAVWNVVAAPPYALTLHTWCFPVTGCIGYRGYFTQADAQAEADGLAAQGLEVEVYGVPAYSTLGYMNWAGATRCFPPSSPGPRATSCACCSTNWRTRWCMPKGTRSSTNRSPPRSSALAWRGGWPPTPRQQRARPMPPARRGVPPSVR
jgi:hypothetical protein